MSRPGDEGRARAGAGANAGSDLRELYQQVILDHNRAPRNYGALAQPSHQAEGTNPLCGDRCAVTLAVTADGVIRDIGFEGKGCAISVASASLMTEALKGRSLDDADALFERFRAMVTGRAPSGGPGAGGGGCPGACAEAGGAPDLGEMGSLRALEGVRAFPSRVKCASLAWHALRAALQRAPGAISTE